MRSMAVPRKGENMNVAERISSLLKNPERGGMPAIARQATRNVMCVTGMCLRKPPISAISLLCTVWMMAPAPRKSRALNMAWVKRWNMEAM